MKIQSGRFSLAAAACAIGCCIPVANAQWTDDPTLNTAIVAESGDQVQPKVVPTSDGGAYISWFDNRVGGFDVYMQRINAEGEPQWASGGILIADRSFSSSQDYDLTIDSEGHAVVAFRDDRFGGIVVTASRVAPDGMQVWGANGVQPSITGSFIGAIRVASTSDGNIVVGWYNGMAARVVKLDLDGEELWATDIGSAPVGSFTVSDLIPSDGARSSGEVVVLMTTIGTFITPRHLYAQKLSASGQTMWASPTAIHTGPSLQIGNFPSGMSDGAGGVVTAWYHLDPLQVRAQHVDSSGAIQFAAGGALVSANDSRLRVDPSAAHNVQTGETFVAWRELDSFQNALGVYAQKLNAAGDRQWTEDGINIFPTTNEATQVRSLLSDDGAQVYFAERLSPSLQHIRGAGLDSEGNSTWDDDSIDVSIAESGKSRLTAITSTNDQAILVWQDTRSGTDDLYAQSVNPDGSLGPADDGIPGDLNGDGVVDGADLLILLGAWGKCSDPDDCPADLNDDGVVDGADLLILLGNWG